MTCTYLELTLPPVFSLLLLSRSFLVSVHAKRLPLYAYTSFDSWLVLLKLGAVSKCLSFLRKYNEWMNNGVAHQEHVTYKAGSKIFLNLGKDEIFSSLSVFINFPAVQFSLRFRLYTRKASTIFHFSSKVWLWDWSEGRSILYIHFMI